MGITLNSHYIFFCKLLTVNQFMTDVDYIISK